ncbi:MAG: glycosyltransferase [Pseudomonas sp.]|uniref:glycosyltransferase family 2 protein n=1 Tax=Pseudomonas sp. TaxID=306 RepID=UPI00339638FB
MSFIASPCITIVLATYNRPDVLGLTLQSVLLQTERRWQLLVIGDRCDERTQAVINDIGDPRIRYLNLTTRCGEQAGPNSVGLQLATTEFIALLNHDDLWLPDHLEQALTCLQGSGKDLYVARAAFGYEPDTQGDRRQRPLFREANPLHRKLRHAYTTAPFMFEPCSSWVLRKSLADKVGPWRSGRDLARTSLQDWMMRAWRAGAQLCSVPAITVLKFNTHHQASAQAIKQYEWGNREQASMLAVIASTRPEAVRQLLEDDLHYSRQAQLRIRDPMLFLRQPHSRLEGWCGRLLLSRLAAGWYWLTAQDGYDLYNRRWGKPRGSQIAAVVGARVGEAFPPAYDMATLLRQAQDGLGLHE